MALAVGDYVQVRRKINPAVPRGARGTVVRMKGELYRVTSYEGPTFWASADQLTVLVKGTT